MRPPQAIRLFAFAATTIWIAGCGGGSKTPPATTTPPVISVNFSSAAPTSLVTSATTSLTAVVNNDSSNGGVKWTVTCGSAACGSFSPTSTASGTATTYTAPSAVPTPATVTVTATSVADGTKTATATITIAAPPPPISVALTPAPPTSLVVSATTSLTAVVSNDSANGGVKWSVTCGSSSCGSFSPTSTASGTATTYTAPSTAPSPATVTVTATSVTDTSKTATATISITTPVLTSGNYVYHLSGQDSTGPYFLAGAFTVQNGVITAGEQDFIDHLNSYSNNLTASGSALTTAGGNVQIVLNTGNSALGVNGMETFRGARVSASRVLISEFDTFGSGTGSIDLQTSTAAPSGGYAFNLLGLNASKTQAVPLAIGGIIDVAGTTISLPGSVFDYNNGGAAGRGLVFSSGSVTAPDTFGRLTFTLTPSATVPSFALTGYIVGTNRIQLVEKNDTLSGDLGGIALGQGTSHTGNFTAASVANTTYVFTAAGADGTASGGTQNLDLAGSLTLNADLTVSGTLAANDVSTVFRTFTIATGGYTVDARGSVTINGVTPSLSLVIPFGFQLYLDGNGNALELGVDNSEVSAGMAYQQTASAPSSPFAGSYALSGQGFGVLATSAPAWSAVGPVTVASNSFTGFTDYTIQGGTPTPNLTLTGTETSATSTLALTGLNAASAQTSNSYFYLPIDNTRVLAIETDGKQLGLLLLEGVSP